MGLSLLGLKLCHQRPLLFFMIFLSLLTFSSPVHELLTCDVCRDTLSTHVYIFGETKTCFSRGRNTNIAKIPGLKQNLHTLQEQNRSGRIHLCDWQRKTSKERSSLTFSHEMFAYDKKHRDARFVASYMTCEFSFQISRSAVVGTAACYFVLKSP